MNEYEKHLIVLNKEELKELLESSNSCNIEYKQLQKKSISA